MPLIERLAFDRTGRRIDADGRLHVDRSHISKAVINPYYGQEIPGFEGLGLDAQKIYRLFRDPVELERGAPTFARLPILSKHVPVTVDKPQPDLVVGAVGSEINFNAPYLDADLCFWDATAIAGIETNKVRELSCAYRYVPVMEAGEFEGQPYDGRMTEIQGNHLALVEVGRAGSDVVVADKNPFISFKDSTMKMSKVGAALFAALCVASPILAQDSALPALVGNASKANFNKEDVKAKLLALDASLDSNKLDAVLDAILDVEQQPTAQEPNPKAAEDESPADKLRAMLAGKCDDATIEAACALLGTPAADEFPNAEKKDDDKEDNKAAMDSMRKDLREMFEATEEVRETVGKVVGMDSAAEIYGFALDHMKIDRTGVEGAAALRALYRVAGKSTKQNAVVAQDAAGLAERFPDAARFTS
jgi:hypothetical protein